MIRYMVYYNVYCDVCNVWNMQYVPAILTALYPSTVPGTRYHPPHLKIRIVRSSLQVTPLASQRVRMRLGRCGYSELLTAKFLGRHGMHYPSQKHFVPQKSSHTLRPEGLAWCGARIWIEILQRGRCS